MEQIPLRFQDVISHFSFAFRKDVWQKAQILLIGAIICPGSRTVCNVLRSVGLHMERNFPKFHRFLSTDKWSGKKLSEVLLCLLVGKFVGEGEAVVFGLDDTIERRWGPKISKRGIYRDPVRSSKSHFVKCSGLRWLSLMLLTPLPWLEKGVSWGLPVLTMLCPSERYCAKNGKRHKKVTDWAGQVIMWLSRVCKGLSRPIYLVGDGSFAVLELFMQSQLSSVPMIARMKMNARLYDLPPKDYPKSKRGPKPPVGGRIPGMKETLACGGTEWKRAVFSEWYGNSKKEMLITSGVSIWRKSNSALVKIKWVLIKDPEGSLEPVLLGCTNPEANDEDIVRFFVRRWRVEVTFAEVRRHLGVESQRQWSDLAIERTTPCLLALFSVVCLMGQALHSVNKLKTNNTAWYIKKGLTFSDVLSAVRLEIFQAEELFKTSKNNHMHSLKHKIRYFWFLLTQTTA